MTFLLRVNLVSTFLVAETRLYILPCWSVRPLVRPSVTFLNCERFSHYCSYPIVRDWIAVYPALFLRKQLNFHGLISMRKLKSFKFSLKWCREQILVKIVKRCIWVLCYNKTWRKKYENPGVNFQITDYLSSSYCHFSTIIARVTSNVLFEKSFTGKKSCKGGGREQGRIWPLGWQFWSLGRELTLEDEAGNLALRLVLGLLA